MMGPEESIALEHQTRSIRLRRLVREIGVSPPPEFFEYVIPARAMPPGFQYDTPVLRVVFPENTFFDTAKSDIVPSAMPIVEAMARMLEGDVPDVALFIAGHTDNRGSEEYNHNLSVQRARTVAQALRLAGAGAPDIWSVGFGESLPLYANNSPLNMAYNRRVEFLFGARPEAVANWLKDQLDFACSGSTDVERLHCLSTLKVRKTYVVDPVERSVLVAPDRPKSKIVTPQTHQVTVTPPHRQIVINLAERSYVVRRPET
jgi:OmpA-OmpF porin, OOP family